MVARAPSHSFVDVVENTLGLSATDEDVMRLERRQVEEIAARLLEFYEAWSPPASTAGAVRVFVEQSHVPWIDWHPGMPFPLPPLLPLLYVDSLVIEDPVSGPAERMLDGRGGAHWTLVQRTLASALTSFKYCRPLLADGSLVLAPEAALRAAYATHAPSVYELLRLPESSDEQAWRAATTLAETEIRNVAAELFPEVVRTERDRHYDLVWTDAGTRVQVVYSSESNTSGQKSTDVAAFGRSWWLTDSVVRSMCAGTSVAAALLPGSLYQDATYRAVLTCVASAGNTPDGEATLVLPALSSGRLPAFVGVPPKTLVALRQSEPAFDAWRSELRNAIRLIRTAPATPGFATEAGRVLDDALLPKIRALDGVASVVGRAKRGARAATIGFTVGAVSAAVRGEPGLGSALAAAGAGSVANLAQDVFFPARDSGARAALLRLMPYHRANQDPLA